MGIRIVEGRRPKPGDEDVYIFNEFTRKKYPWLKVDQPAPDDNLAYIIHSGFISGYQNRYGD
ncbi:hypothetical protein, partial [Phocaeicola coprocola]|uniref:hypothetical protein n=1 Tax=Phocaeicola coprocola TaxID=310298 RepID=UPI0022E1446E